MNVHRHAANFIVASTRTETEFWNSATKLLIRKLKILFAHMMRMAIVDDAIVIITDASQAAFEPGALCEQFAIAFL